MIGDTKEALALARQFRISLPNLHSNETELQLAAPDRFELAIERKRRRRERRYASQQFGISRDDAMYADETGLVDLAGLVKKYVKSLYGADSPQFQQISGLEFTRPR